MPLTNAFILSLADSPEQAARLAGIEPASFLETILSGPQPGDPAVTWVSDGLRALSIAAQTISSGELGLALCGQAPWVLALASAGAVGARNVSPIAQVSGYSLRGVTRLLEAAELTPEDVQALSLDELPAWLAGGPSRYGLLQNNRVAVLLERI